MTDGSAKALTIYPTFYFNASPTYNSWVKLTAAAVHGLQSHNDFEGRNLYFYNNHPISFIVVTGIIVDFEPNSSHWLFHIDDGSGVLIEVVLPRAKKEPGSFAQLGQIIAPIAPATIGVSEHRSQIDMADIEIGKCVRVRGTIREFRGIKQLSLEKLAYLQDTTEELVAWEAAVSQYQKVLSTPWVLSRKERAEIRERARKDPCQGEEKGKRRQDD